MSWWTKLFANRETTEPDRGRFAVILPGRTEAGIHVDEDAALAESTANACGTLIARSFAMLPAHVFAAKSAEPLDGSQRISGHPVEGLLNGAANPEISGFQFKETMKLCAIFHGNGYAEIEVDDFDRPVALWPIHPRRVTACRSGVDRAGAHGDHIPAGSLFYEIANTGSGPTALSPRYIFHLAGPAISGPIGMSVIEYAKNSIGLSIAQQRYAANFMRNQGAPSGMVKVNSSISDDGMKRLRADVDAMYSGPRRAGKIIIGDSGWDWQAIGVTPQDAEFLKQRQFSVEEIARAFGVPPQLIGDTSKMTFANFEQAGLNFLGLCILPWTVRFEQEVNRKLLTPVRGRAKPFLKINTAAIVRANLEAQYRAFALGRQWGWLSVNDIRRTLDLEPIGSEGDVYLQPSAMAPVPDGDTEDETAKTLAATMLGNRRF